MDGLYYNKRWNRFIFLRLSMNQKQSKANVILIVVDQMRADALSINCSDDLVVTPTMDMMASMGYNFLKMPTHRCQSCVPAKAAA